MPMMAWLIAPLIMNAQASVVTIHQALRELAHAKPDVTFVEGRLIVITPLGVIGAVGSI